MQFFIDLLDHNLKELLSYIIFYLISFIVFNIILKNKNQQNLILNTLKIIKIVLSQKLGDKSNVILDIWIDGLKKIQDGEFSDDDKIDQFLRYIKLIAKQKDVELSNSDIETLHTLIISTFTNVEVIKPKIITQSVNQFSIMNKT